MTMTLKKHRKTIFWAVVLLLVLLVAVAPLASEQSGDSAKPVVINELMASNGALVTDEDGDFSDWIELYNPTGQPVNLSGWSLTDDADQPQKWPLPDITLPAQSYRLVFASGKDRQGDELHTNFRLNKGGEFLALYSVHSDSFVDVVSPHFPPQLRDVAYGRYKDTGRFGYLTTPTPGQPNNTEAKIGIVSQVRFTPGRGFFEAPTAVELFSETPEAVIRYTLDGTEPTETNGQLYSGLIPVARSQFVRAAAFKPDYLPSPVATHSYIFLDEVITQPPNPAGWPAAWGVYNEYYPGLPVKGSPVEADYAMDPRIVEDPRYQGVIKESLTAIPSLFLVTAPEHFDIYAHAVERGPDWERPVSVEFIDPTTAGREFQINAGIRMQGVSARWEFMPKKSFRLFFKGDYGPTRLEFPLFPDSPVETFDTLVLRGGANRSYAGYIDDTDYTQVTYTRDEWLRASQIAMSGVGSHGIFVHLYLNGLYWGLYNLVERPDASFMAAHLGGEKEDWFALKHGGTILNPEAVARGEAPQIKMGELISGSEARYERLLDLALNHDLAVPEHYAAVKPYLDINQFIDYIILNLYAGNNDWGDNNWYIGMREKPPGKLHYFVWDGEVTWDSGARWYLGKTTPHHKMRPLFLALMENPDFRMAFADRLYKNLFNDGPLTDKNSQARWLRINRQIEQAIVAESARWGDARYEDNPIDQDDWRRARDNVLAQMEGNAAKLTALAREQGAYPPVDPPTFNRPGGPVEPGFDLAMTAPGENAIYFTTDGADPRQPVTGQIGPTAVRYSRPLIIANTTPVKARVWQDGVWSALNEATFRVDGAMGRLQITELMYNPTGGDAYEFIELKNTGAAPLDLSEATFEGVQFSFAGGTAPLAPGEVIVLARDAAAFAERYPDVQVAGVYDGQLSNRGETITVKDSLGNLLVSVTYDDDNGWPLSADGRGDSLVLIDPERDPSDPKAWRGSARPNGSPADSQVASRVAE